MRKTIIDGEIVTIYASNITNDQAKGIMHEAKRNKQTLSDLNKKIESRRLVKLFDKCVPLDV